MSDWARVITKRPGMYLGSVSFAGRRLGAMQGWVLAHGWSGKNPERLAQYVRDINGGKRPRSRSVIRSDYVATLRVASAPSQGSTTAMPKPFEDAPPSLSWEQYVAGGPCPGCGRLYRDAELWDFRGTANFTDTERERYEVEEQGFKQAHGECRAGARSVLGSLT